MRLRVLALSFLLTLSAPAMAVEQPKYTVELDEKPFQIRDYGPMTVASVRMPGDRSEAVNTAFRVLAGYIFGANKGQSRVAMTAPVTQRGETIAMTAPVTQDRGDMDWTVRFTMPSSYTLASLPKPDDARIHLSEIPARRVAAVTFSGFWSDTNFESHRTQLQGFVARHGLKAVSGATYAYYDPPWMPWFWRTNEVQVEIAR